MLLINYIENLIKYKLVNYILADPRIVAEISQMTATCLKQYLLWSYYVSDVNDVLSLNQENQEIITQSILEIITQ